MTIRNAGRALIIHEGKLLVAVYEDQDGLCYGFPGGKQEFKESLPATVKRECLEELGAEVHVGDIAFIFEYIKSNHESHCERHRVQTIFDCQLLNPEQHLKSNDPDPEQVGIDWIDLEDLENTRFYPTTLRGVIKQYANAERVPVYIRNIES